MSAVMVSNHTAVAESNLPEARWGQLPLLSIVAAGALGVVALSYIASRHDQPWAMWAFWSGALLLYMPMVARLWRADVSRLETIGLLAMLGGGLYLVSALRAPLYFINFDEFLHWRTTADILQTHQLFTRNYMLPVSPLYPGLEIVAAALAQLSGLTIYQAGVLVVGAARLVLVLALYLVFEKLSNSVRAAGLGVAIYMGSSTFVFFDAQYGYESLGLPLGILIIFLLLKRSQAESRQRFIWSSLTVLAMLAIVVTHHVSAYMFAGFLGLWALTTIYANYRGARQPSLLWLALLLLGWNLLWLFTKADITIGYLSPHIQDAILAVQRLLAGQGGDRQALATGSSGGINYERLVGLASVAVIMSGLGLGYWHWWRHRQYQPLTMALALWALTYPSIPVLRLNSSSWEISNRLAGFLFIGVGFIIGLGLAELSLPAGLDRLRRWLVLPGLALIICGGIIGGSSPTTRLPGSYVVGADERSVELQGMSAAEWAFRFLGLNNHMAGDRVQTSLMGSYGRQRMVLRQDFGISISGIFLRYDLDSNQLEAIKRAQISYLVVDRRITTGLPLFGHYFESWEQMVVSFVPPVNPAMLEKFDHTPNVSRIYDSGDILIYDTGALAREP
jgi:hypothetical protein